MEKSLTHLRPFSHFVAALAACGIVLLFGSCATPSTKSAKSKAAAPAKPGKPIEITFWAMEDLGGSLTREIKTFEKQNPGIRVRMTNFHYRIDSLSILERAGRKKQGPDLLQLGSTWVPRLASQGMLPEVSDWIDELGGRDVFTPESLRNAGTDQSDKLYALPWVVDVRFLAYRKDALAAAGMGPENLNTLAGFEKACLKTDQFKDASGKRHRALDSEWPQFWVSLLWLYGTDLVDPKEPDGLWNEHKAAKGISFWFQLQRKCGAFDPWDASLGGPVFAAKGPWEISELNPQTHGIAPIPAGPGGAYTFYGGSLLAVPSYAKHPAEARRLAEFLLSHESQLRYCEAMGNFPVRRDTAAEFKKNDLLYGELRRHLARGDAYLRSFPRRPEAGRLEEIFSSNIYMLQARSSNTDEASLMKAVHEALQESRRQAKAIR